MPTYRVEVPGKGTFRVESAQELSDAQVYQAALNQIEAVPTPKEGLGAAVTGGTKRLGGSLQTAIESLAGPEEAARRGLERQQAISQEYGPGADLDKVIQTYRERGLLPAAGEAISQLPGAFAEQVPNIAATLASAKAGAMAGARMGGPRGALIGGFAGAAAPIYGQVVGSGLERQQEAGADISLGRAALAAIPGTAAELVGTFIPLGRSVIGKLLGPQVEKVLLKGTNESVERLAKETISKSLAKGAVVGPLAEIPTEITQSILERAQAGLPLTTPDAFAEYGQAAYGAGLVGVPFGAAGRAGQRYVARGQEEERAAGERKLQEELAAAERAKAEAEEAARKFTPEYRQELNNRLWTLKDELAQVEPIAKDKTVDEDVRAEAIARAKAIKAELKDIAAEMKVSMKGTEEEPTLAKEKAKGVREMPVVDEFGNIVKPKTKPLTEEEYGQKSEAAATQWQDTQARIQQLREKEAAELEAKQQKTYDETQSSIQNYLAGLDEIEQANTEELAKRVAEKQRISEEQAAQEITLDRIQLVLDNFGLRAAGVDPEVRQAVESKIDEGVIDRTVTKVLGIQGLEGRTYRGEDASKSLPNIQEAINKAEEQRQKALTSKQELMDDKGQLTPAGYKLVANEAKLNELKRLKGVIEGRATTETPGEAAAAGLLETVGKRGVEVPAVQVEQNLPSAVYTGKIKEANNAAGGAFDDLVSYVDDISRKRFLGGAKGQLGFASSTEEALRNKINTSKKQVIDKLIEEVAYTRAAQKLRPLTRDEATTFAIEIDSLVDMLVTRSLAPAPGMVTETEYIPAQMRGAEIVEGATEVTKDVRGVSQLPFGATQTKAKLLSTQEQDKIAAKFKQLRAQERSAIARVEDIDRQIGELKEPSTSPKTQELLQARAEALGVVRAAQKEIAQYKQELKDVFNASSVTAKQALGTIKAVIRGLKRDTVLEGQRPVRAEKPLLKKQYAAAPTDLIKDLDRVLRMENLQPDVRNTLEQAQRRMEEGGISAELEELVEEQVGRILRGTDRPFTLERDVTQPGGKRAMAAAGKAELIDDIKNQLRVDSDLAQYAQGEQRTLVPNGQRFAEVDVQPSLFPETEATTRATPAQFQRLQKSGAVQKAKAKEARLKTIETAAKKVKRERELTPEKVALKEKQIMDRIAELSQKFRREEELVSTKVSAQWAALDEDIKKEVAELKTMKAKLAKMAEDTPEQKAGKAAVMRQQKLLEKVREKYAKEDAQRQALLERAQSGLGLPGRKAVSEQVKTTVGTARRVRVVPIKSKAEIDSEVAARRAEAVEDMRRKARATSPEAVYEKLKAELKEATTARNAKANALKKLEQAGGKKKDFAQYKKLSDEVDRATANVQSLRENVRLLEATQYVPDADKKRQAARGPIGGEVKWYDKKFTPDQMRQMASLGVSAFDGTKTYSVDDSIDFAIGDKDGGGIDLDEANKRMAEVQKKLPDTVKFKYFPTMGDVTTDILKDMSRQGIDIYETRIRGGVKPDGTVFVIGENHTDMTDLNKTIAHEFVGHYTFEGMLGPDGMRNLLKRVDKAFGDVFKLADTLGVREDAEAAFLQAKKFGSSDADANLKALREVVAYTMEKRVDQNFLAKAKRWLQELVGAAREFFRKMGIDLDLSTSDLFYMMKQANKAFEEGKPIAYKKANGDIDYAFSKPKYNPGLEELGAITDKIVGRQDGMWNSIKANATGLAARVQFVDRFAALEALANKGVTKGIIDSLKAQDMMYFARMADQRHSFVAEIANNGGLKLKDSKRPDGRIEKLIESERGASLKDVSQALLGAGVGNPEATGRLFTMYLAAERAERVGIDKLNFGGGISKAELQKALNFGRNNKAFQKARELYNEYNRGLVDFAVQTGALSKEQGAKLSKTNDYVPFYRMRGGNVELIIGSENPIRIGDIKSQPYLQELVGGDTAIMDFFTSSLQNTTLLTDMALRNLATRNAAFTLADLGVLEKKGEKGIGIRKGDGPANPNTIRFKLDGEDFHVVLNVEAKQDVFGDIPSDLVVKGMEGMKVIVPGVVRGLALPANILRKFVTRDPRYAIRQIFRDSMAAALTTGANITPVVDTMGEIVKMYGKGSEAFQKLQRRGVIGGQVITGAPEDMAKIMQQILSGKPGWDLAMAKLDEIAMKGDAGTRMAMYNSFLKQGLSEREATLASLESMNFGRRGVSPSIYFLNATIPFFNAGIQGIDVLYRAFTGQMPYEQQLKVKKKLLARGATMAIFTMAYAAMMQDDEAYKNAPPEQRYGNWFIRIPGFDEPFRVPIPFEVGLLFKAIPEGLYNAAFSDEKGSKIAKDLTLQLMRSLPGNPAEAGVPVPTAIKPFIETALNKSFFTGRDIVDARLEGLEKQYQYRDKTPELLKALGPVLELVGLSPVQAENIIRGYTGSMGIGLVSIVDPVMKTEGGPGGVEKRVSEMPLVGGLFQPNDAGRVITEAYESVQEIQKRQGTYKALVAEGKYEEAQKYLQKNISDISMASMAGSFRQQMGELTKAERSIKALPESTMSPEDKRARLDELRKLKIKMAEQFKGVREQIERQAAR